MWKNCRASQILIVMMLHLLSMMTAHALIKKHASATPELRYHLHGLQDPAKANVKLRLDAEVKALGSPITTRKTHQFIKEAPEHIEGALQPFGYFNPQIRSSLRRHQQQWIADFTIQPGPAVHITASSIKIVGPGKNTHALQKLLRKTRRHIRPGSQLNTTYYEKIKDHFYTVAEKHGYLRSRFTTHVIAIHRQRRTATIELVFNTGPRYYFGAVYFSKNPMATSFLRRFLPFRTGQVFSSQKLFSLQNDLSQSIYFNQVSVVPKIDQAKNYHIPVYVKLFPAKPHMYSFGLGYGTDTGARGSFGWEWRRINPFGHYVQGLVQITQKQNNNAQIRYVIPGEHPASDHFSLHAGVFTDTPNATNVKHTTYLLGFNHVLSRHEWLHTYGIQGQYETFKINDRPKRTRTLIPSAAWERIQAHDRINTHNGYRVNINLQAGLVDNTNGSFVQGRFRGTYIKSFAKQRNRLILRTEMGITAVQNFANMPPSQQFYAGGAQNLRGYDYQELGPGRYLLIGSVELQHRLHGKLYGNIFYNAGNAWETGPIHLKQAAGFGILYRTPIGPIGITLAHPFDRRLGVDLHSWRIQFSMGPDL